MVPGSNPASFIMIPGYCGYLVIPGLSPAMGGIRYLQLESLCDFFANNSPIDARNPLPRHTVLAHTECVVRQCPKYWRHAYRV